MKTIFHKLEPDLAINRNVNDKLTQQFILVERNVGQTNNTLAESALKSQESIQDVELKECVLKIFNECDTPVDLENIEASHRLKLKARPKKVIIKLSKRKDVFSTLQRKTKLRSLDITNVGLPLGTLVFINQSLCSYYKYLWSLCKRLHLKKLMHYFWVSNDNVSLKVR